MLQRETLKTPLTAAFLILFNPLHSSQEYTARYRPKAHTVLAYITIHVLLASDPRPEGSKLLAAVENFVAVDLEVVLATGNKSHNSILKSSNISGGIFLV